MHGGTEGSGVDAARAGVAKVLAGRGDGEARREVIKQPVLSLRVTV